MSSIKSVDEILNISDSFKSPDKMAYRYIIKQVDKLIRSRALENQNDATFQVPAVVMFQPYFNRDNVAKRIARHYRGMNFFCKITDKYTINIAWRKNDKDDSTDEDDEDKDVNTSSSDSESESESDSESDSHQQKEDDSSSDEELPTKKIIVHKPESLAKQINEMKNKKKVN